MTLRLSPSLNWDAHVKKNCFQSKHFNIFSRCPKARWYITGRVIKFYTMFIRPGLEYTALAWHPGLTQQLAWTLLNGSIAHSTYCIQILVMAQRLWKLDLPLSMPGGSSCVFVLLNLCKPMTSSQTGSYHNVHHCMGGI